MADYDFYVNAYLGSEIPEKTFGAMAKQAEAALERFQRIYRVEASGEEVLKMAVCAMAEVLYGYRKRGSGVTAETVGSVSVRYESGQAADKSLARELYRKASIYLDIYRGAG